MNRPEGGIPGEAGAQSAGARGKLFQRQTLLVPSVRAPRMHGDTKEAGATSSEIAREERRSVLATARGDD
jgi:hypothetical protein